jgi:serine protease Do
VRPANLANLIEAVKPAVVNISAKKVAGPDSARAPQLEFPSGSPFDEFFRRFFDESTPGWQHEGPTREAQAHGSGFIIDAAGYVLTNNHVVEGAEEITVTLNDGTQYPAEMIGQDGKTDLALLKIESEGALPYVTFGDSDVARPGDWVVAIGNPFGLGGTATTGIISARGRDIQAGPFDDFIQIDAPINRGNSGGPLFDTSGQVIGVNTAIYSPNGGNVGIGFAIPASLAQSVVDQLREDGYVKRGWLGVQIQPVTQAIAQSLGLSEDDGALVAQVTPDSPAAKAGIEPGDVITAVGGKQVVRLQDLTRSVAETKAKERVKLEVWRDGSTQTLTVVIGDMPGQRVTKASSETAPSQGRLGLALAALTPEGRARHGLSENTEGVLVVSVRPNSPAAKQGLRPGDVIEMVGQQRVSSPAEVVREVERAVAAEREAVLLLVGRSDDRQFITLNLA